MPEVEHELFQLTQDANSHELKDVSTQLGKEPYLPCLVHICHHLSFADTQLLLSLPSFDIDSLKSLTLDKDPENVATLLKYLKKLFTFLKATSSETLLVAEQYNKVETTIKIIRKAGYKGTIIYYPTGLSNPVPFKPGMTTWDYSKPIYFEELTRSVELLGISRLVLLGQYFESPVRDHSSKSFPVLKSGPDLQPSLKEAEQYGGCVPYLARSLISNATQQMEIRVSPIVWNLKS